MPTDSLSCPDGETALMSIEQTGLMVAILDGNPVMTLATNRADGWPQATQVNYLHDGGALYFVVGRESQKLANIRRDGRVSITIGGAGRSSAIGLSMAATVTEVTEVGRIAQLNTLLWSTSAGAAFSPHPAANSIAVLKAEPWIVSLIDYARPPGQSQTFVMGAPPPGADALKTAT